MVKLSTIVGINEVVLNNCNDTSTIETHLISDKRTKIANDNKMIKIRTFVVFINKRLQLFTLEIKNYKPIVPTNILNKKQNNNLSSKFTTNLKINAFSERLLSRNRSEILKFI